ncbi:MAG: class E sortase [Ilumatobacteraceae bacterium]
MMNDATVNAGDRRPRRARPRRPGSVLRLAATAALLGLPVLAACGGDDRDAAVNAEAPATTATTTATTTPATTQSTSTTSSTTTTSTTSSTTTSSTTTSSTTSSSTTSTTAVPTPTLPEQPDEPVAPPPDAYGDEPLVEIGAIEIPRLDILSPLYQGIRLTTLDQGPGHWPGTALPGQDGNTVVAGHRTSHNRVFRHIDQLEADDQIIFHLTDGSRHVYEVTGVQVIEPTDVWIVDPTPFGRATLFACHPPGSTRQRIVAFADLVTT